MERFWTKAKVAAADGGWTVALDRRPVRTPAGQPLVVPSEALAEAIAREWDGVEGTLDPARLRLTGLANAAIDRIAPDPEAFVATLAPYAETDLLCYRAAAPAELVEAQADAWEPPLEAIADRYGVDFVRVAGVMPVPQPALTREVLVRAIGVRDAFALAAFSLLVTTTGSLALALLVADEGWDAEAVWAAATLDEHWQWDRWGRDEEAEARLAGLRRQYDAAAQFLTLLGADPAADEDFVP